MKDHPPISLSEISDLYEIFNFYGGFLHNEMTKYNYLEFEQLIDIFEQGFRKLGYQGAPLQGHAIFNEHYSSVVWIEDPAQQRFQSHKEMVKAFIANKKHHFGIFEI